MGWLWETAKTGIAIKNNAKYIECNKCLEREEIRDAQKGARWKISECKP